MKKTAALLTSLALCSCAYGLPIGNPWEAGLMRDGLFKEGHSAPFCAPSTSWWGAWSIRAGFYGDYVYNYHMEVDRHNHRDNIHDTQIWTNAAYFALNFFDRFDLFATLGTSEFEIDTPGKAFGSVGDNSFVRIETATDFSWSIGIRATLWECGGLGVGAEAQYFSSNPDINFVKREAEDPDYRNQDDLNFQEWQIGLGAAYRINIASCVTALIPYLGVKWGRAWVDLNTIEAGGLTLYDLRSDRLFGYAFGMTLLGCNKTSLTVEARYIDEKALYVNGQARF